MNFVKILTYADLRQYEKLRKDDFHCRQIAITKGDLQQANTCY